MTFFSVGCFFHSPFFSFENHQQEIRKKTLSNFLLFCYNQCMKTKNKRTRRVIWILIFFLLAGLGWWLSQGGLWNHEAILKKVPAYNGQPWVELEGNHPRFTLREIKKKSFEKYARLDSLGRCGPAIACIGQDLMPMEPRGSIGSIQPSGWQQAKYPGIIPEDPPYLYNRCHLIAYQLSGENANELNLITGTRYFNVSGMQTWENQVASYVRRTGNHVMYRVTPVFQGREKVCRGVTIEAWSVEDQGAGICFYVFVYNVQPGIEIEYRTGESHISS